MVLDTVSISIVTEEEDTPVVLDITAKDGVDSEHVCLDTVVLSRVATEEDKQVGMTLGV